MNVALAGRPRQEFVHLMVGENDLTLRTQRCRSSTSLHTIASYTTNIVCPQHELADGGIANALAASLNEPNLVGSDGRVKEPRLMGELGRDVDISPRYP